MQMSSLSAAWCGLSSFCHCVRVSLMVCQAWYPKASLVLQSALSSLKHEHHLNILCCTCLLLKNIFSALTIKAFRNPNPCFFYLTFSILFQLHVGEVLDLAFMFLLGQLFLPETRFCCFARAVLLVSLLTFRMLNNSRHMFPLLSWEIKTSENYRRWQCHINRPNIYI